MRDEEDYCATESTLLVDLIRKYETVSRNRCVACGNPWFFEMESVYQCTTCGDCTIHCRQYDEETVKKLSFPLPEPWISPGASCKRYKLINPRMDWDGEVRHIVSNPWRLGHGQWVVKVSGVAGGIAVEALEHVACSDEAQ